MPNERFKNSAICRLDDDNYIEVCARGAHIYSWVCGGQEQLFVSGLAESSASKAIRGGVPVIFPQFGEFGDIGRHGFARLAEWSLVSNKQGEIHFRLLSDDASRALWPYDFEAELRAQIDGSSLRMSLRIKNTGGKAFSFTSALHTYFLVDDISNTSLENVSNCTFWDNGTPLSEKRRHTEPALRINNAIDRIYFQAPKSLLLLAQIKRRIASEGFNDTVVWNPWREAAADLSDMKAEEYQNMLCVEAACVEHPITLTPGEQWQGSQAITMDV